MEPHDGPYGGYASPPPPQSPQYAYSPWPPTPRRRTPRWLLIAGLALAFALTLGIGAFVGSAVLSTAQAATGVPSVSFAQGRADSARFGLASTPGAGQRGPGQCGTLTVTSVSGDTIVAKAADGSSVTIHTSASTTYTKGGQSASASAVTAGSQIHVDGTHNSDGSITATSVDVQ